MASQYYNTDLNSSKVNVRMPEHDTSGLLKAGQAIGNSLNYWKNKDIAEQERLLQAKKEQHALDREKLMDSRYEADKQERLEDKNRLFQKDYNTANAMSAIENKDAYIAGRMSAEQKAIQDTLANATPEERLQMQQELKGYDPKASGQQWANTALSQSNVDSKDITNLKRDIVKQAADEKYKQDSLALQKQQYNLANQERADRLQEKKKETNAISNIINAKLGVIPKDSEEYVDKTGKKIIPEDKLKSYNDESGNLSEEDLNKVDDIQKQLAGLTPVYTEEQLKDKNFQEAERQRLYPDAAKSTILQNEIGGIKAKITNSKLKYDQLRPILRELVPIQDKLKGLSGLDITEKEKNDLIDQEKILINKLEQMKIDQKKPVVDTKNISLDEFMNINKAKNEDTKKLQESLSTQLASIYSPYEKKAKDKFSVDETVQKQRPLTTPEFEKNYTKELIDNFVKINGTAPNEYDLKQINSEVVQKTLLHSERLKAKQTSQEKADEKKFEAETKVVEDKVKRLEDENKILLNSIKDLEKVDDSKDFEYRNSDGNSVNAKELISEKNNIINQNKNKIDELLNKKD